MLKHQLDDTLVLQIIFVQILSTKRSKFYASAGVMGRLLMLDLALIKNYN